MRRDNEFIARGGEAAPAQPIGVTYVDGPYAARRELLHEPTPPPVLMVRGERGLYRRSVRCADDGALRYVWERRD